MNQIVYAARYPPTLTCDPPAVGLSAAAVAAAAAAVAAADVAARCCWCLLLLLVPKRPQASSKMAPTWFQNRAKMASKWPSGALLEHLSLLEPSWSSLGGLLEASWLLLGWSWRRLGRSWGGLGGVLGALGAVLGALGRVLEAKTLPKWRPRGSKMESKRLCEPKTRFLQKPLFFFFIMKINDF